MFEVLDKFIRVQTLVTGSGLLLCTNCLRYYQWPSLSSFFVGARYKAGLPAVPSPFCLILEPLAETIRTHTDIQGVEIGQSVHKIALYADDILLFLTNAETSIPTVLKTIDSFSLISGYKINYDKSEIMPLGGDISTSSLLSCPFKWSRTGLTYLGIRISPDLSELWKLNLAPLIKSIKDDLERWFNLPISWMGRINLIKMNILPRILYPMQMLPLWFPKNNILDLERSFSKFIWQRKKLRVKMKILQLPVDSGGQALPNLKFYNWACHTRTILNWLHSHLKSQPCVDEWVVMPYSLLSLLTSSKGLKFWPEIKNNPIIFNTVKVWQDIMKRAGRRGFLSGLTPLTGNRDFLPGVQKSLFHRWHGKGIRVAGDL